MSAAKNLRSTQEVLAKIVGAEWVSLRNSYLTVSPKTSEEISQILKVANKMRIPVSPRGGGTGWWSSTRPKAWRNHDPYDPDERNSPRR